MPNADETQESLNPNQIHMLEDRSVHLDPLPGEGYVLDLGGGGEGIIGRLAGRRVVAVDRSANELAEAPGDYLKVIMDARHLQFLDESFDTVTAFFTLMYMPSADALRRVLTEAHRVLRPGGRLLAWDARLPARQGRAQDAVAFRLRVELPGNDAKEIATGYGAPWPDAPRDVEYYVKLAREMGYVPVKRHEQEAGVFHLVMQKKG